MFRTMSLLTLLPLLAACGTLHRGGPETPPTRSFHVRYEVQLAELPAGEQLALWVPLPKSDPHQHIRNLKINAPWPNRITTETLFGNEMIYLEGKIDREELTMTVEYDVDRWEYLSDFDALRVDGKEDKRENRKYLEGSQLGVVTDEIREKARKVSASEDSTLEKARAFYDIVQSDMVYDKSGEGWGRGDTVYACDVGRGNCTDYHSYFIALCQASGIPARFQIGLYGPYENKPNEEIKTGSYHCWAEFRVPGKSWVPVDISEGDKSAARKDYFFGNHTDNRVTLSTGRDLMLSPSQKGTALNYFVNPYAEVGGEPYAQVSKTAYWTDLDGDF